MSIKEIFSKDPCGFVIDCDVCHERKEDNKIAERLCNNRIHICESCRKMIPDDLVDALRQSNYPRIDKEWRCKAARHFLFNIHDSDDSFVYELRTPSNLKVGTWAVYGNDYSEEFTIQSVESIEKLEERTGYFEFKYREGPLHLLGVLNDGKLRNFVLKWSLEEE
ncbi:MAG: hypothetical protein WC119_00165 [Synergistaceae bacterium]